MDRVLTRYQGTDGYLAPEFYSDDVLAYDGVKTDIFALGVTLFTLYSGYPPFESSRP